MQKVGRFIHKNGELLFSLLLLFFSAFMFVQAFSITGLSSATDVAGPALMPKLIFGLMTLLSILLLIDYSARRRAQQDKAEDEDSMRIARRRGLIAIGGILLFVFLMDKLGFLLSSILYVFGEIYLLGPKDKRKPLLWAAIAVLFCAAVYYLFRYQVYVKLPKGILG